MDKIVVVTGASSGIGRATACLLAEQGCRVVLTARRKDLIEEAAATCPENAHAVQCDLTRRADCDRLLAACRALGDGLSPVLINAAGAAEFGGFLESPFAGFERQVDLNLVAPARLCHACIPWMLESGGGQIVNVLSIAAKHVFSGASGYASSKAGLHMFSRVLAEEFRRKGIRVTSVIPGSVDTQLWDNQSFLPNREDMLSVHAVAETIRDVVFMPDDRSVDEITLMPLKGIL